MASNFEQKDEQTSASNPDVSVIVSSHQKSLTHQGQHRPASGHGQSSSPSSSAMIETPNSTAPKAPTNWEKGDLLGVGQFGEVYKCRDIDTGGVYAVKSVKLGNLNTDSTGIFKEGALKNEIEILRTLQHEKIVKYFGCHDDGEVLSIFIDFMPGGSVRDLICKEGKLQEDLVRNYSQQVLLGLAYLHEKRIIHRDIKATNLLIDNGDNIKLASFGVSKRLTTICSATQSFVGTTHWMAPEVIKGEPYNYKADIWSLGCTVVEMLSGEPPFHKYPPVAVVFKIGMCEHPEYELPQEVSSSAREFLALTFHTSQAHRPSAKDLLNHGFAAEGPTDADENISTTNPDEATTYNQVIQGETQVSVGPTDKIARTTKLDDSNTMLRGNTEVNVGDHGIAKIYFDDDLINKLAESGQCKVMTGDKLVSIIWPFDQHRVKIELKVHFPFNHDTSEIVTQIFNRLQSEKLKMLITTLVSVYKAKLKTIGIGCIQFVLSMDSEDDANQLLSRNQELTDVFKNTIFHNITIRQLELSILPDYKIPGKRSHDKMPDHHLEILQRRHNYLLKHLFVTPMVDILYSKQVIDEDDLDQICTVKEAKGRVPSLRLFLNILRHSGDQAYPIFLRVLNINGVDLKYVADELSNSERQSAPTTPTKWQKGPLLGTGTLGKVYKCYDADVGHDYAVKLIDLDNLDADISKVRILENELQSLCDLQQHERIVQYFCCHNDGETLSIYTEFMPGGSVKDLIVELGKLQESLVRKYSRQILLGLEYLHQNRMKHRDVKAANVLRDIYGNVKLVDYGVYQHLQAMRSLTDIKTVLETPNWNAPEVTNGDDYSYKADIWHAGCTIVHMISGKPPSQPQLNLDELPQTVSDSAKDFLENTMKMNPVDRSSAKSLLRHRYVEDET